MSELLFQPSVWDIVNSLLKQSFFEESAKQCGREGTLQ